MRTNRYKKRIKKREKEEKTKLTGEMQGSAGEGVTLFRDGEGEYSGAQAPYEYRPSRTNVSQNIIKKKKAQWEGVKNGGKVRRRSLKLSESRGEKGNNRRRRASNAARADLYKKEREGGGRKRGDCRVAQFRGCRENSHAKEYKKNDSRDTGGNSWPRKLT